MSAAGTGRDNNRDGFSLVEVTNGIRGSGCRKT
jgi:hypothetical protein